MLAKYASNYENSRGKLIPETNDWHLSPFHRDKDRILHSSAFRRLQYKTQVFANHEGDHFRTRLTHSLEVANIARSITKILKLDEDLAEAIALAHDIGHSPFGHSGEDALQDLMEDYGGFDHNAHTLKILTKLENKYAKFNGLNLTWETLEGIVKHNGPLTGKYANKTKKIVPEYIQEFSKEFDLELDSFASLEAQIAAISDDIAYNNHDLEDGFRAGLISIENIENTKILYKILQVIREKNPKINNDRLIHELVRSTMSMMIYDLLTQIKKNIELYKIEQSNDVRYLDKSLVSFSPEIDELFKEIGVLLKKHVFRHYKINIMNNKARRVISKLFKIYMKDPICLPEIWQEKIDKSSSKTDIAQLICDFIAGMTDRYAIKEYLSFYDVTLGNHF